MAEEWLAKGRVVELLGVSERQVDRWTSGGRLPSRLHRRTGKRIYDPEPVQQLLDERQQGRPHWSGVDAAGRKRAAAWAQRELARKERKTYWQLYLKGLARERERGSPATTGNPPTSTHSQQAKGT